jgi:protoporphyrinogen oxidase
MAWMWARFKARTPRLGTFEGGFQAFLDNLAEAAQAQGANIQLNTAVGRIRPNGNGGLILQTHRGEETYDQGLVTTSPQVLAKMAPQLSESYVKQLLSLKSMGAVVLILALKNALSEEGIYWHNLPKTAGFPFLSLVEHTNFIPPKYFGGDHLVYCGDYLDPDHEYFSLEKEELLERFVPALKRFNPRFEPGWIRDTWLFKTPYAQPVPPIHHSEAIPDVATPIKGLWYASMSQVYPWDRGTNFAVQIARETARQMLKV